MAFCHRGNRAGFTHHCKSGTQHGVSLCALVTVIHIMVFAVYLALKAAPQPENTCICITLPRLFNTTACRFRYCALPCAAVGARKKKRNTMCTSQSALEQTASPTKRLPYVSGHSFHVSRGTTWAYKGRSCCGGGKKTLSDSVPSTLGKWWPRNVRTPEEETP